MTYCRAQDAARHADTAASELQELEELSVPVAGVGASGDVAGGHVECGERGGGAVGTYVMGAPSRLPGAHRQQRLCAVQRLLGSGSSHRRTAPPPSPRMQIEPDGVGDLSSSSGSVLALKVHVRCGRNSCSRQMRARCPGSRRGALPPLCYSSFPVGAQPGASSSCSGCARLQPPGARRGRVSYLAWGNTQLAWPDGQNLTLGAGEIECGGG